MFNIVDFFMMMSNGMGVKYVFLVSVVVLLLIGVIYFIIFLYGYIVFFFGCKVFLGFKFVKNMVFEGNVFYICF